MEAHHMISKRGASKLEAHLLDIKIRGASNLRRIYEISIRGALKNWRRIYKTSK
jgi:hypothetical protein